MLEHKFGRTRAPRRRGPVASRFKEVFLGKAFQEEDWEADSWYCKAKQSADQFRPRNKRGQRKRSVVDEIGWRVHAECGRNLGG